MSTTGQFCWEFEQQHLFRCMSRKELSRDSPQPDYTACLCARCGVRLVTPSEVLDISSIH